MAMCVGLEWSGCYVLLSLLAVRPVATWVVSAGCRRRGWAVTVGDQSPWRAVRQCSALDQQCEHLADATRVVVGSASAAVPETATQRPSIKARIKDWHSCAGRVCNTPAMEILEIWKFAKSPGNFIWLSSCVCCYYDSCTGRNIWQ